MCLSMESCCAITCRGNIITLPPVRVFLSLVSPYFNRAEERETNGCHIYFHFFKNFFFFSLLFPGSQGSFPLRCNVMLREYRRSLSFAQTLLSGGTSRGKYWLGKGNEAMCMHRARKGSLPSSQPPCRHCCTSNQPHHRSCLYFKESLHILLF